jgi:hypothetical protein
MDGRVGLATGALPPVGAWDDDNSDFMKPNAGRYPVLAIYFALPRDISQQILKFPPQDRL